MTNTKKDYLLAKGYSLDSLNLLSEKLHGNLAWSIDEVFFIEQLPGKAVKYKGKIYQITHVRVGILGASLIYTSGIFYLNKSNIKELKIY